MVIVYGYKTQIKNDKDLGESKCSNCNHITEMHLAREIFKVTIFYIPVFRQTRRRIVLCENCGIVEELKKYEYKARMKEEVYQVQKTGKNAIKNKWKKK